VSLHEAREASLDGISGGGEEAAEAIAIVAAPREPNSYADVSCIRNRIGNRDLESIIEKVFATFCRSLRSAMHLEIRIYSRIEDNLKTIVIANAIFFSSF